MTAGTALLKWFADKIESLIEQLRSLLRIEVRHTSEITDERKGTHKRTEFALRIGDSPPPPKPPKRSLLRATPKLLPKPRPPVQLAPPENS